MDCPIDHENIENVNQRLTLDNVITAIEDPINEGKTSEQVVLELMPQHNDIDRIKMERNALNALIIKDAVNQFMSIIKLGDVANPLSISYDSKLTAIRNIENVPFKILPYDVDEEITGGPPIFFRSGDHYIKTFFIEGEYYKFRNHSSYSIASAISEVFDYSFKDFLTSYFKTERENNNPYVARLDIFNSDTYYSRDILVDFLHGLTLHELASFGINFDPYPGLLSLLRSIASDDSSSRQNTIHMILEDKSIRTFLLKLLDGTMSRQNKTEDIIYAGFQTETEALNNIYDLGSKMLLKARLFESFNDLLPAQQNKICRYIFEGIASTYGIRDQEYETIRLKFLDLIRMVNNNEQLIKKDFECSITLNQGETKVLDLLIEFSQCLSTYMSTFVELGYIQPITDSEGINMFDKLKTVPSFAARTHIMNFANIYGYMASFYGLNPIIYNIPISKRRSMQLTLSDFVRNKMTTQKTITTFCPALPVKVIKEITDIFEQALKAAAA